MNDLLRDAMHIEAFLKSHGQDGLCVRLADIKAAIQQPGQVAELNNSSVGYLAVMWAKALAVSNLPMVDEAIRNFAADQTEDNAVCMVREILGTQPPAAVPEDVLDLLGRAYSKLMKFGVESSDPLLMDEIKLELMK